MTIDPLPTPPQTSDPADFQPRADAFLTALQIFAGQVNAALGLVTSINQSRIVDVVDDTGLALATAYANGQTVDGQVLTTGMRILRAIPGGDATNGIYDAPVSGAASRSIDCNSSALLPSGLQISVTRGTNYKGLMFLHKTTPGFTLGTTALTFGPINKPKTYQRLISGTSYVPPKFCSRVKYRMRGGDGAGGGAAAPNALGTAPSGTNGGDTGFNSITAKGGKAGTGATGNTSGPVIVGGNGGPASGSGTGSTGVIRRTAGAPGRNGTTQFTETGLLYSAVGAGTGNDGGSVASTTGGGGGSGGGPEEVEGTVDNPGTITYAIGAKGSAGAGAGSGASAGLTGVDGFIDLEESYG